MSFVPPNCPDNQEPIVRDLDCLQDSVTVCPPDDGFLTCELDSITVCAPTGGVQVTETTIHDATVTSVPASVTTVTLLNPNMLRKRALFFNDSSSTAFIKFGVGALTSSFSLQIPTREYYELTFSYVGEITAVWNTADGDMHITEFE